MMFKLGWGTALMAFTLGMGAFAQEEIDVTQNDPFLWLEEVEGEDALAWVREQNERSLALLEAHPAFGAMLNEAKTILNSSDRIPAAKLRGDYAYNYWQDADHVRGLWRRMPTKDYLRGGSDWEVLLDLDAVAEEEGANWVYQGADCLAPGYTRCLLTLSPGGSDAAVVREYDLASRSFVEDGFVLPEAKSSVAWLDADTILVATDFGEGTLTDSGYARQVRRWRRGQALPEAEILYEAAATDIWSFPFSLWDGESYRGGVFHGETFYDFNWFVLNEDGVERLPLPKKAQLSGYASGDYIIDLKEDGDVAGETYQAGAIVALTSDLTSSSTLLEPGAKRSVSAIATSTEDVVVELLDDIEGKVRRFEKSRKGEWRSKDIRLPKKGIVSLGSIQSETGAFFVTFESPIQPDTLYYVEGERSREVRRSPEFFDAEGMKVQRFEAKSSDGTAIPYTVIAKEDVLKDGPAPTVQYGYGGFEIPILPTYSAITGKLWIERGGVYVLANIRGGGEYGPAWHQAGLKQNRQLIYDDFQAVSEDLIARGITTPDQLAVLGGSNGGLLTGVTMVQRPDLYGGVGIGVPLLDMLRFDRLLAGASWVGEYGDPDIPEERAFLETISPYHNLKREADYPRPFFFTSTKDDRVHPGHARKMARLMQEYGHPFLYFENIEGGHSAASNLNQKARQYALEYAYFAGELGLIPYADETAE
ncbi:MAG: prolyl oligopeptidase family serine peptidase [Parvularcula sp.]|jgi:prolyl oligopeptidase|nr:prolyl oligopeptidase family serine peptidase [Parvularcula sp.]